MVKALLQMIFLGDWIPTGIIDSSFLLSADIKIINLECVVATGKIGKSDKAYPIVLNETVFETLANTRKLILNVANNHTYDAGERAFEVFVNKLCELGIPYYGTCDRPYVEVKQEDGIYIVVSGLFKSRSRGRLLFPLEKVEKCISEIRGISKHVIVTPHWGGEGEYTPYPSPVQRRLAKKWLGAGADVVIGHHSHSIQGVERFEGKTIFYSLGNFHFPHEESALYPLTRFGLGVDYHHGEVQRMLFFKHDDESTAIVNDADKIAQLKEFVSLISSDLTVKPWTNWRWARAIGKLYTDKNAASWKLRFKKNFLLTLIKWSIVNVLPKTVFLRLGKLFSDKRLQLRYNSFDKII